MEIISLENVVADDMISDFLIFEIEDGDCSYHIPNTIYFYDDNCLHVHMDINWDDVSDEIKDFIGHENIKTINGVISKYE